MVDHYKATQDNYKILKTTTKTHKMNYRRHETILQNWAITTKRRKTTSKSSEQLKRCAKCHLAEAKRQNSTTKYSKKEKRKRNSNLLQ